jgi:hypothetical protein
MLHKQGATFKTGGQMSLDQHARATAYVVFLTVLASLFCCGSTSAQEPERSGWNLAIAPYFWAAGISGDVGVRNVSTNVDESFSDILQHLTFGGMLLSEARNDRLAFFFAPLYVRLGDRSNPGPFSIDVDAGIAVIGAGASYRVAEWDLGSSGEGPSRKAWIEPLAGARYTYLHLETNVSGPLGLNPSADKSRGWVDPIIGLSAGIDISKHWALTVEGDIGGFGVGSDFTWNALGLISYRTSVFGVDTRFGAGYRALSWDYDKDNLKWDVVMYGPFEGMIFRF